MGAQLTWHINAAKFASAVSPATTTDCVIDDALREESSTELDRLETTARRVFGPSLPPPDRHDHVFLSPGIDVEEWSFRHSGWQDRRTKVRTALASVPMPDARLDRLDNCGCRCRVELSDDHTDIRVVAHYCHDRWCVPCQRARAAVIRTNINAACEGQPVRFITLTLRHSRTPLKDQIDRLYRSFKALRRRPEWSRSVKGGLALLEIKLSSHDGLWHPHLHCLCVGSYFDARTLSAEWLAVTGDSSIVDIKLVREPGQVAHYVTKYVTKTVDSSVMRDAGKLQEAISALHGRHLLLPFGAWEHYKFSDSPQDDRKWIDVGTLPDIYRMARQGDPFALRLADALDRKYGDLPRPEVRAGPSE